MAIEIDRLRRKFPGSSVGPAALLLFCGHCLLMAGASGQVAGSVADDSGRPVAGAHVLINQAPAAGMPQFTAPPVVTGPLAAMAVTGVDGSFSATLPPGSYIACAEAATPGLLDPCHWAASAPDFTVTAGLTPPAVRITMTRGAVIQVQVNDQQSLLRAVTAADLSFQIHVVTAKGLHYAVPVQSSTATSRIHAITIPFDTPVNVRVMSPHLAVNDSSGKPVPAAGLNVNVPAGTSPPSLSFTVTGPK